MFKIAIVTIIIQFFAGIGHAQVNLLQNDVPNKKVSPWSGFTTLGYSTNMYGPDAYESRSLMTGSLMLNYRVQGANLIRGHFSGSQEQTQGRESRLNDGQLSWVNNSFWTQGKILTVGQHMRAILPTSRESRERDHKHLGVSVVPIAIANLTPVGLTGVTFIYLPGFTRNFHAFEQNQLNEKNIEYSLNHVALLTWSVTEKLYLQPLFVYGQSWNYGGTKRDDVYQFGLEAGYAVAKSFTLAGGFSNGGAIRSFENANDQTIRLYDSRTASVYMDLYYTF